MEVFVQGLRRSDRTFGKGGEVYVKFEVASYTWEEVRKMGVLERVKARSKGWLEVGRWLDHAS